MCGIVGIFTTRPRKELNRLFKRMLAYDSVRGTDSTGVFTVDVGGSKPDLNKTTQPGYVFIVDKPAQAILNNPRAGLLLGHNRASTRGKTTPANAHPFWIQGEEGDVALVHNGTLHNYSDLPAARDFEVDSEAVANSMCVQGLAKTVASITGSYSLVWYDLRANTLNFYRETARPMHLFRLGKDTLVFSSQVDIALAAGAAEGIQLQHIGPVEPWHHYVFKWDNPVSFTKTKVDAKEERFANWSPSGGTRRGVQSGNVAARTSSTYLPPPSKTPAAVANTTGVLDTRGAIWDKYRGTEVTFLACSVTRAKNGQANEVSGVMMENPFYTVIGYDYSRKIKDGDTVKGFVTSMGAHKEVELYVRDLRTEDTTTLYPGPGNVMMTEERWRRYTKGGCMSCKSHLIPGDTVHWWHNDPICDECFDDEVCGSSCGIH